LIFSFCTDTAPTELYPLSLHDALPIYTLERVLRSKFSADEFVGVLRRMQGYANNTTTQHPQRRVAERELSEKRARDLADYVASRSEEHTSELQSLTNIVCRLLLENKKQ